MTKERGSRKARSRAAGSWALAAAALLACGAAADRAAAQSDRYRECLAQAQSNPGAAREAAAQWEAIGGGAAAKHCAAIALIGLGAELRAAELLTEIGSGDGDLPVADRVAALILGGDLWFRNGRLTLAGQLYSAALSLDPSARGAQLGQAQIEAAAGRYAEAVRILSEVIAAEARAGSSPEAAEALTLRAAALRASGDLQAALIDAELATSMAPQAALAWFERGAAERATGRQDAARESWLKASMLDPNGPAGELARLNLQRLELD